MKKKKKEEEEEEQRLSKHLKMEWFGVCDSVCGCWITSELPHLLCLLLCLLLGSVLRIPVQPVWLSAAASEPPEAPS